MAAKTVFATVGLAMLALQILLVLGAPKNTVDQVVGFYLFRRNTTIVEYLLLEKKKEPGDWSPPKGKCENGEACSEDTACRELSEETKFACAGDIEILRQCTFQFEYTTKDEVVKKVTLWPALLKDSSKPLQTSSEHSDFVWADRSKGESLIKKQYKETFLLVADQLDQHYSKA